MNLSSLVELGMSDNSDIEPVLPTRRTRKFYTVLLLVVLLMAIVSVVSVYAVQMNSASSLSLELTKLTTSQSSNILLSSFSADIEFAITNRGLTDVTLDRATVTLYLNGMNVQTKDFSAQVITIKPGTSNTYSGTMVTFTADTVDSLSRTENYQAVLELQAYASSGFYSSAIDVTNDQGNWNSNDPITTEVPILPILPSTGTPNGQAQIIDVALWAKANYSVGHITLKNTGNLPITDVDYSISTLYYWSFGTGQHPLPGEQVTHNWAYDAVFTSGSTYQVTVKVTYSDGSMSTLNTSVTAQ